MNDPFFAGCGLCILWVIAQNLSAISNDLHEIRKGNTKPEAKTMDQTASVDVNKR